MRYATLVRCSVTPFCSLVRATALIQAANTAGKNNTKLGRYYQKKKKQKDNASIAHIAVASSMIDIIYKVLTTKKPYNPKKC